MKSIEDILKHFDFLWNNTAFTQAANLRNHERIHSQNRPYVCGDCGKAFTQITNLNVCSNKHSTHTTVFHLAIEFKIIYRFFFLTEPSSIAYWGTAVCVYRTRMWSIVCASKPKHKFHSGFS